MLKKMWFKHFSKILNFKKHSNTDLTRIRKSISGPKSKQYVLGIETSCDGTSCAVVDEGKIIGKTLSSQQETHLNNGGIIPPIAQNLVSVVNTAIASAGMHFDQLDAIAATVKPGLPMSLELGTKYAKHLCRIYHKPFIPIHHIFLYSSFSHNVTFPGGHIPNLRVSTSSSFRSILEASAFVDKTLFIKEVFWSDNTVDEQPKIMITAPRRFGKSVNLDMLCCFLELEVDENTGKRITTVDLESGSVCDTPNYKLFTGNKNSEELHLQIMTDDRFVKTHFGKYPIIKVDFQCGREIISKTDAVDLCKMAIHEAFLEHPYLYKNSESQLTVNERDKCELWCTDEGIHGNLNYKQFESASVNAGLKDLSKYLRKFHGRKVFVLIDEFDSIILKAVDTAADINELKSIIEVVMGAIGMVVKGNDANLAGVLITGILDLHGTGISTLLGNLDRMCFGKDEPILKYYGFNLEEVEKLFEIFSVDEGLRKKAITKYNGYYTEHGEHGIFNPYAIAKFLRNRKKGDASLQSYWQESGYVQSLENLFKKPTVQEMIKSMLKGRWFPGEFSGVNLEDLINLHVANRDTRANISSDLFITFLLRQGYLSYIPRTESLQTAVGIPDDIRPVFINKMVNHLTQHCGINGIEHKNCQTLLNSVMQHVANKDKAGFIKDLKSFTDKLGELIETASIDPCNEAGIETVVSSVVFTAGYTCGNQVPNIEQKRADLIAHKDGQGIIIELKYKAANSLDALTQLLTRGYYKNFTNKKHYGGSDIKLRLVMGMHFTEKKQGSKVKATVHCLRDVEINEVLKELNIEKVDETGTEIVTEVRIAMACATKEGTNSFVEKAICIT